MRRHWLLVVGVVLLAWFGWRVVWDQGQKFRGNTNQASEGKQEGRAGLALDGTGVIEERYDHHGCLVSDGSEWCEKKQRCRLWGEEECYSPAEDEVLRELAQRDGVDIEQVKLESSLVDGDHVRLDLSERRDGFWEGKRLLALRMNGRWVLVYDSQHGVSCPQLRDFGFSDELLVGVCKEES